MGGDEFVSVYDYLRLPESTLWDIIGPLIVAIIFIIILVFALRVQRRMNRAQALVKPKEISQRRRRYHKRIHLSIPLKLVRPDNGKSYNAEVIDISVGGIRLLTPLDGIAATLRYKATSDDPPWDDLGEAEIMVLRMAPGPNDETAILRARWINMEKEQRLMLKQVIKAKLKNRA